MTVLESSLQLLVGSRVAGGGTRTTLISPIVDDGDDDDGSDVDGGASRMPGIRASSAADPGSLGVRVSSGLGPLFRA